MNRGYSRGRLIDLAVCALAVGCVAAWSATAIAAEGTAAAGDAGSEAAAASGASAQEEYPPADAEALKRDSGTAAGQTSLPGSGHFTFFECGRGTWYLVAVDIYAMRYGQDTGDTAKWQLAVCNLNLKTLWAIEKPYSVIPRENAGWIRIAVPPVKLLVNQTGNGQAFWLNAAFDSSRTRGAEVGHDGAKNQTNSKAGLPDQPAQPNQKFDWMIRAVVSEKPGKPTGDLGVWVGPLTELKYDSGQSDGMLSKPGIGPAVHFQNVPEDAILEGFSVYGRLGGMGYDPSRLTGSYWFVDDKGTVLTTGSFPYRIFGESDAWAEVQTKRMPLPKAFWLVINARGDARKGINFGYSTLLRGTSHSKTASGPGSYQDTSEKLEWMVRAWFRQQIKVTSK